MEGNTYAYNLHVISMIATNINTVFANIDIFNIEKALFEG